MGLAGVSLWVASSQSSTLSHTARFGAAWDRLITRSQTRVQTAPSHAPNGRRHQGHQPLLKQHVGKAALGLAHRVDAEWRGAHVVGAAAQVERAALTYASAASAAHSRVYGGCAAEAGVSEVSGSRVSGCPRAPRYFNPYPVALPYP